MFECQPKCCRPNCQKFLKTKALLSTVKLSLEMSVRQLVLTFCGLASVFLLSPNITFEQPCAKKWRATAVMPSYFFFLVVQLINGSVLESLIFISPI